MIATYWNTFVELLRTPFGQVTLIWGIVPLYFGLVLNELTSAKASFRTAIQTGFSFLWAGAQWLYPYFKSHGTRGPWLDIGAMLPVNLFVTFLVLALGATALVSGLRRRYPKHCAFLGYTRFANYFMILVFPLQARCLRWTWDYLIAIALFALPVWLVLHLRCRCGRNRAATASGSGLMLSEGGRRLRHTLQRVAVPWLLSSLPLHGLEALMEIRVCPER